MFTVGVGLDGVYQASEDSFAGSLFGPGGASWPQRGAEQDLVVARVLESELAIGAAAGAQCSGWVIAGGHCLLEDAVEPLEAVGDDSFHELVEIGEVAVDGGRGDSHLAGDGA
jgi:hypothetical protein